MQRKLCFLVVVLVGLGAGALRAENAGLEPFYGKWRCVDLVIHASTEEITPTKDDLDLAIRPDGDGFRVRWTTFQRTSLGSLERRLFEARFGPTERPGVFGFDQEQRSLFGRLFAAPASGNPLQGETLLWARLADERLVIYSLGLTPQGDFDLNRHQWTPDGDSLIVTFTRRTAKGEATRIRGRLEPAGG